MPRRKISDTYSSIGQNLLRLRTKLGYTQKEIADLVNIDRTTYSKYETGATEPSVELLQKFAELFSVDFNTLVVNEDEISLADSSQLLSLNTNEARLIRIYGRMSTAQKNQLLQTINHMTSPDLPDETEDEPKQNMTDCGKEKTET